LVAAISHRRIAAASIARASHPARIMMAVLPFENLTGDPSQEYVTDGLTEEIISRLGQADPDTLP